MNWELVGELSAILFCVSFVACIAAFILYIRSYNGSRVWFMASYWLLIACGILMNISSIATNHNIGGSIISLFVIIGSGIYNAVSTN